MLILGIVLDVTTDRILTRIPRDVLGGYRPQFLRPELLELIRSNSNRVLSSIVLERIRKHQSHIPINLTDVVILSIGQSLLDDEQIHRLLDDCGVVGESLS